MSLNESPDCKIEAIIRADATEVVARVSAYLEDEQMRYFSRNQDCLTTDLHSTKARVGINQAKLSDFELKGNKISYEARFWFYIPEYAVGCTIDQLMLPGLEVGKIYLRNPKLKYAAEELINLISNRTIIVPKGTKVLEEGILAVPVMPFVHLPDPRVLTPDYLKAVVMKKIPREDLYFAQPEQKVDRVIVPAGSGVISHTSLFTQQNEIYILDHEHTDARVGSKHTNGIIYLELMGDDKDIVKERVHIEVYKPTLAQHSVKKRFYIDLRASLLGRLYEEGAVDDHTIAAIREAEGQRFIKLNERYDQLLHDLQPDTSLILQDFPNRRLASYLIVAADMGLISDLTFRRAPQEEYFFRSEDLAFMDTLQNMGVEIYWKNPLQGDLVLYKRFFMRSSVIPSFNEAFSSRKLAAIYGTAGKVDADTQKEIVDSVKSFKEFHGGICGVLTGGNTGSIMSFVSETAASLGMLSGAVYWKIPGVDIDPHVDFAAYLSRYDLLERQEILSETTEADIYFKGGVGTNLENAITFVKKKLGIGHYKPQIFVGDFYKPLQDWLNHLASEGMADPRVFESCYFIKHGREIFETLCTHFGSEDKMIHEVSVNETWS
ncbi:MAG: LOG family protein [Deltaproteobacteria bacterium]|nr:LOG family protein [Deltaproteobacteria bacterium]MBW2018728.1 LOG family protein [Deltaproteobacteria bacterium]MBW2073457.1 LOG family protein [Deltaproteobacteria bacterium]